MLCFYKLDIFIYVIFLIYVLAHRFNIGQKVRDRFDLHEGGSMKPVYFYRDIVVYIIIFIYTAIRISQMLQISEYPAGFNFYWCAN